MDTHEKSNSEFQTEVNETIAKHEASINKVNTNYEHLQTTLQTILMELQSLRVSAHTPHQLPEVNPFYPG